MRNKNRIAQVWIETVLYTLIGLALLGVALGFIMPKVNQTRDKLIVEQSINSLSVLDDKIIETIDGAAGSTRKTEFLMKKGELYIDSMNDEIIFAISGLSYPYSEPGVEIKSGRIKINSTKEQKNYNVYLKILYSVNITYDGKDGGEPKKFTAASIPYTIVSENKGVIGDSEQIDIREISG
jgi:hypothetical protein